MAYKSTFKFRAPFVLVRRASRVRKLLKQTKSEFGRDALRDYVERKERELSRELEAAA